MPKISFECQYCGERWVEYVYSDSFVPDCKKCKSKDYVTYKEFDQKDTNIYGYLKK